MRRRNMYLCAHIQEKYINLTADPIIKTMNNKIINHLLGLFMLKERKSIGEPTHKKVNRSIVSHFCVCLRKCLRSDKKSRSQNECKRLIIISGTCWNRTSDLMPVKHAL